MPGKEYEEVQAIVDDIMAKTSGTEDSNQPTQGSNFAGIEQQQQNSPTQKLQQQRVEAVQQPQLSKDGTESSSALGNPLSVCSGGRRSTSADSERSLRLEIAESSGGGTSGTESPLVTPIVDKSDGGMPTITTDHRSTPKPIGANAAQPNDEDKTPVAITTENAAIKAKDGGEANLGDEVQKCMTNPSAEIGIAQSEVGSHSTKDAEATVALGESDAGAVAPPSEATEQTAVSAEKVPPASSAPDADTVPLLTPSAPSTSAQTNPSQNGTTAESGSLSSGASTTAASSAVVSTSAAFASSSSLTLASSSSTIVTVSIAGKSAASISAAAAAAAARSTGGAASSPAPPTLALMRAPIQPTPVTRILPRPTAKKSQQLNTAVTTTTTAIANCPTWATTTATTSTVSNIGGTTMANATKTGSIKTTAMGSGGVSVRGQLTSGSTVFTGAKTMPATTTTTAANPVQQHSQKSAADVLANGSISTATTKFAAVVPQRVGGGVCSVAPLTPLAEAKEQQESTTSVSSTSTVSSTTNCTTVTTSTEMCSSSLDKFTDTLNRVAAGTEVSPPHPTMVQQLQQQPIVVAHSSTATTTLASSATTNSSAAATTATIEAVAKGQLQPSNGSGGAERGQQALKPKPPKKKKAPAVPKAKGAANGVVETEQRNATTTISVVDMQPQQPSSTASPFPLCPAVSSNAPGGGMLFPSNFALAATPNGTVGASLMTTYPNGGASGGITQYFIRQTTSSGHQQLIPVIPSQQQFFFSPMPAPSPAAETADSNNANTNGPQTALFQGQPMDDQPQRTVVPQPQQQLRNLYFRSGNDILMPAMVSNNIANAGAVNLSSSAVPSTQHSATPPNFVASTQYRPHPPQQKGTFVGIQPKGTTSTVTARTAIAPKGSQPTGEGPPTVHQPVSAPVVMIGGPHHSPYQQLAPPSQQQFFLTPTGAIVTLQAPPHQIQQQQQQQHQHLPTFGNVRIMPSTSDGTLSSAALSSGDAELCMQKNGVTVSSTPNPSRPTAACKGSSPKRKRKTDAKNVSANTAVSAPIDQDPTKYPPQHQMAEYAPAVDEEENEPPPVLCRVFNRSEDEPIVSTQSVESVFQREAKIIRERIYDASGRKFGPLKHFIDGFEIEEDVDPFPCEHQQLLDRLKREQVGLEAEVGGDVQKETTAANAATVSPEKNVDTEMAGQNAPRRKGRKRAATASSSVSSSASSPTHSPKRANAMETEDATRDRTEAHISSLSAVLNGATHASASDSHQQQQRHSAEEHASTAGDSATESAAAAAQVVKKGRRRELDGLLKMDFGKHSPFQTSDPDKYAQEVLIEARQQQRTLALAQEEQRNARRSVESSGGGSTTGKSSKRDKHAKKPFSPPVSPLPESRSTSVRSTTPTAQSKTKHQGEKAPWSSKSVTSAEAGKLTKEGNTIATMENKLKASPKDSFSSEQRRSDVSNASEESDERCLYCRRSFKEVSRDKDHVQYCSKACRKQLKAAKRMKHSAGSLEDGLNSSTGIAGDEPRSGVVSTTPSQRRSDPSSSSDSSGQQQQSTCHITSPLGSAFSAMQPQMLSKRRLPIDQHAEQLMSLNQRLSANNGVGLATSFASTSYGQSPPDPTSAMLAVPMAIRPTSGAPPTMLQYGSAAAMYFNTPTQQHQLVVSSSSNSVEQQQAAAVHAYQQQQQQHEHHMLYAPGAMAGGSQQQPQPQQQQHFFSAQGGPSGVLPGTPATFLPPSMARQSSLTTATASSSSPATPVPTPTNFMERNVDIEALVARGVHTWSKEEVAKWVNFVTGSDTNGDRFIDEDVDGASLLCLQSEQLKTELKFKLGPHIKIWSALEALKRNMIC